MGKIDITVKEPKRKASKVEKFFVYLIQWTWGLPVNIVGGIAYLICTKILKHPHSKFGYANIVYLPWNAGGLSMGLFIFVRDEKEKDEWLYNVRIHEYGHTWQCLLLGPLYYLIVAIPSVIWCNCFAKYREKNNISYYKLYCEAWANVWGEKGSGLKRSETK
jgi:hypothetical protein